MDSISAWTLGDVELLRVPYFDIALPPETLSVTAEEVARSTLGGPPWSDGDGNVVVGQAFWVIRSARTTVVVDPCGASDEFLRSGPEAVDHQDAALAALAAAGVERSDVDIVVLTHLDGIGMAAVVDDAGGWSPAFPNAPVVITRSERSVIAERGGDIDGAAAFEELAAAGHVREVDPPHELAPAVTLVATGGHSPGHAVVMIGSSYRAPDAVLLGHLALTPIALGAPTTAPQDDPSVVDAVLSTWLDHSDTHGTVLTAALWPFPGAARVAQRDPLELEPVTD